MFSVLEGVIPDTLVPFLKIVYLCQFFVDFSGAVDKTETGDIQMDRPINTKKQRFVEKVRLKMGK